MKLTTYFRSTAAYRVRIALNWKQLSHELVPVNLLTGEQKTSDFINHNPEGLVPTLQIGERVFSQSMAILEYLEEAFPEPSLLPRSPFDRLRVRAMAQSIVSDIHPLNNLRILRYLTGDLAQSEDAKLAWYHHWLKTGFDGFERRLSETGSNGEFCVGRTPTLADVCLVPQVYNAHRFEFPLQAYPLIQNINQHCLTLKAFNDARPEGQPDFKA